MDGCIKFHHKTPEAIALLFFIILYQDIMTIFILFVIACVISIILPSILDWFSHGYILNNGRTTEGIITSVQSRSQTDQYGKVHVSYIVSYQFGDPKVRIWRGKFTIKSSRCRFKEGDNVVVYYLPDKPHKNTVSR